MIRTDLLIAAFLASATALAVLVGFSATLTRSRAGKVLAFFALFLFPALALGEGFSAHLERAQTTAFCLSCHIMEKHGRSLWADDAGYLAAAHFQNNRVPRERACYTCHTDYAMFGGVRSKMRGLRHLYVHYLGTEPAPEQIKLYEPYNNRECLHCHDGGRKFLERSAHTRTPDAIIQMQIQRPVVPVQPVSRHCSRRLVARRCDLLEGAVAMPTLTIRKRLVWSASLVAAGLLVELLMSWSTRPLAFVVFIAVACPLVVAGMLLFLWSLVTSNHEGAVSSIHEL